MSIDEKDIQDCSICLGELTEQTTTSLKECGHSFHINCIIESLRHSTQCPYCRGDPYNKKTIDVIYNNNDNVLSAFNDDTTDSPWELREKMLKKILKHKEIHNAKNNLKIATANIYKAYRKVNKEFRVYAKEKLKEIFQQNNISELSKELGKKKQQYTNIFNKIAKNEDTESILWPKSKYMWLPWAYRQILNKRTRTVCYIFG